MHACTIAAATAVLLPVVAAQGNVLATNGSGHTNYTTVAGFFLQDDASTNASSFSYVRAHDNSVVLSYGELMFCSDIYKLRPQEPDVHWCNCRQPHAVAAVRQCS
jgi:hypothetical protein